MTLTGFEPRLISLPPRTITNPQPMDPVEFARQRLGFFPDERQADVLRSQAKRGILNCTRQWGKSSVTAAMALNRASSIEDGLVLVASPCLRQSAEWMEKARILAAHMGEKLHGDGNNDVSLRLSNGSRIIGLPGVPDTTRGFSRASMLLIDEAARVDDELFYSLLPVLAISGGDVWIMSTPNGKSGFFYEMWEYGGSEWFRMSAAAPECPRIPAPFLEEQRRLMTADYFRQEYMCEFVGQGSGAFDRELVERLLDSGLTPLPFLTPFSASFSAASVPPR
jgi:hypothetical protein